MEKIEILAPAGSMESVVAAVRSGADAVYLGLKDFSARQDAENFSLEELKEAADYCHIRGVKVYVTMNTLIFDDEMQYAAETVKSACDCDIDALIVQDIGFASLVRRCCPELPLHASTQMSIHTLSGVKFLKEMGFKRVVLSRELSREEIKYIADNTDIELEVFVHGALCMSVSGQCYFSAMLGGRSGNRGRCAQTCRLPFRTEGCSHALSLKDSSLINYLDELEDMGIASAKIEGRMKRPEYASAAVRACYEKRENGFVRKETTEMLRSVFSRTGFTDGYYTGELGRNMFGYRKKEDVVSATEGLLRKIRNSYKDEMKRVPLTGKFYAQIGKTAKFDISDGDNRVIIESEQKSEPGENICLSRERALSCLEKTGGTPFYFTDIEIDIQEGASLPVSAINKIRRDSLREMENRRSYRHNYKFTLPDLRIVPSHQGYTENRGEVKSLDFQDGEKYNLVFVPITVKDEEIQELRKRNINFGVTVPRGMFGREEKIKKDLCRFKEKGVKDVLCNNLGAVYFCRRMGFAVHGGEFLNLTNTQSLIWAESYGLEDVILSVELTRERINSLGGRIKRGIISYGRLPLMLTRNCPVKSGVNNCRTCKNTKKLQDRRNFEFPLYCDGNCTEVLNSVPINILERNNKKFSTYFYMEKHYVENSVEKVEKSVKNSSKLLQKTTFTYGMYFRGVK